MYLELYILENRRYEDLELYPKWFYRQYRFWEIDIP